MFIWRMSAKRIRFNFGIFQASSGSGITMEATALKKDKFSEQILGSFTGIGINRDIEGKIGKHFVENSPTLVLLEFD